MPLGMDLLDVSSELDPSYTSLAGVPRGDTVSFSIYQSAGRGGLLVP